MWLYVHISSLFLLTSALSVTYFFFFNDTATTEIYTLSLHDALPILPHFLGSSHPVISAAEPVKNAAIIVALIPPDRKSTRLNSSHGYISYAVFCLKKKNT